MIKNTTRSKTVAFYTLGCKLNFSETSSIAKDFINQGFKKVAYKQKADVYVINTCSVTDNANKKCRTVVRQALKKAPEAYVAVIGCYAQLKPGEISNIPGVDMVVGTSEKFRLLEHINLTLKKEKITLVKSCNIDHVNSFFPSYSGEDRTRSFLKIQDGCDYKCSFCTIPLARGKSRSNTIERTVAEAQKAANDGIKEIVLTGVNIGDFGKPNGETFFELIQKLDAINGIERIRISSIEPNLLTDEIITFVAASKKFVPHFHIPLQSGSAEILKAMKRRYKKDIYTNRVNKIKELIPHCCIGVDIIVGFPGETEQHFLDTYSYLNELDISYLHVFSYSERENTTALEIKETVPLEIRAERSKMLHILSDKKKHLFYNKFSGSEKVVLFEGENKDGQMYGYTDNYLRVQASYQQNMINKLVPIKLNEVTAALTFKVSLNTPSVSVC